MLVKVHCIYFGKEFETDSNESFLLKVYSELAAGTKLNQEIHTGPKTTKKTNFIYPPEKSDKAAGLQGGARVCVRGSREEV